MKPNLFAFHFSSFVYIQKNYSPQYRLIAVLSNFYSMNNVLISSSFLYTARIEYENYYMTQSSQKVISPGSNVNISGPVPGTFQHSKDVAMVQSPDTPKTASRRPPMQLPDIPAQGKMRPTLTLRIPPPAFSNSRRSRGP